VIPTVWLLAAAGVLLLGQILLIAVLIARNGLVEWRLRRRCGHSTLLASLCESLDAGGSAHVRAELSRRELLVDVSALEAWLDLVASRGEDPALLPPEEYERVGLVDRYLRQLQRARGWSARAAAAEVLGWTHSPRAVPALLEAALDERGEEPAVRAVALRALGRIRHPRAVEPLISALASSDTWFPPRAAEMLARIGAPAVEPLARLVGDACAPLTTRRWAAQVLGEVRDRRALHALHAALGDLDAELRAKAARALGNLGQERSIGPLLDRLLADPIPFVRSCVARALGQLSTGRTVGFLVEALADPEWWVRLRAVEALAQLGEPARQVLHGALHDSDPQVAREAGRALEGLGVVAELLDSLRREGYSPELTELLVDIGRAGNIDALLDALDSDDVEFLTSVTRIIARVGDARAAPGLVRLLRTRSEPGLQARVIDALRRAGAADLVGEILPLLASPNEWVRKTSLDYLERFADTDVLPRVAPLLQDPNPWAREAALKLMERLPPPPALAWQIESALGDPYVFVRAQAVRTLCACDRLELLFQDGTPVIEEAPEVREAALQGLARSASPKVLPVALALFPKADTDALDQLTQLVREAARRDPVVSLVQVREGGDVAHRWALATIAPELGDAPLPVALLALAGDEDPRVRAAAVASLLRRPGAGETERACVVDALADPHPLVARGALRALALLPRGELDRHLRRGLSHAEASVAVDAALAIALRLGRQSVRALMAAVSDRRPSVRLAALIGLVYQGERTALPSWLAELRAPASLQLLHRWRETQHPLLSRILGTSREARATLEQRLLTARSPQEAEDQLLRELESNPDAEIRKLAAEGLSTLQSRRAVSLMLPTSQRDPAPEVRIAALRFLVRENAFGHRRRYLETGLRDPVAAVQVAAAHLSVVLPDHEAIPLLVEHLETRLPALRAALTDMLAGRAEEGVEAILDAVMGRPMTVELMLGLVAVLRQVPLPLSDEVLEVLLRHRWAEVRAEALAALIPRQGGAGADWVIEALGDPAVRVRKEAVRLSTAAGVDFGGHERAREETLLQALDDPAPAVRARTALAVARLGLARARRALTAMERDPDARVARAARRALAALAAAVAGTAPAAAPRSSVSAAAPPAVTAPEQEVTAP
jgi:HEAT repeat protein